MPLPAELCNGASAKNRLLSGIENDETADIELVGDDGVPVPACRFAVASSSPVLRRMLYGDFAEAKASSVRFTGCDSSVLKAFVEYASVDDCLSLQPDDITSTQIAFELAILAHVYDVSGLATVAINFLKKEMMKDPPLACLAYACGPPALREVSALVIKLKPHETLLQDRGLQHLNGSQLGDFLKHKKGLVGTNELDLFRMVQNWHRQVVDKNSAIEDARKMVVDHIDLSAIEPNHLENIVSKCEFVDSQMLLKAYRKQAFRASEEGILFSKPSEVRVLGAGHLSLNGCYRQTGYYGGAPRYEKEYQVADKILRCAIFRYKGAWFISIVPPSCEPGKKTDVDLYRSDAKGCDQPPKLGWKTLPKGKQPAPTLSVR